MIKLKFPLEEYKIASMFSRTAELKAINCSHGDFGINHWPKNIKFENYKLGHDGKFKFEEDIKTLFVEIELSADYIEKNEKVAAHHIKGAFLMSYELSIKPPEEEDIRDVFFSSFAKISCLHQVWPYWREFCDSMSKRMGLGSLIIPPLHIDIERQKAEDEATKASKLKTKKGLSSK